jgi:hypothetical protein
MQAKKLRAHKGHDDSRCRARLHQRGIKVRIACPAPRGWQSQGSNGYLR